MLRALIPVESLRDTSKAEVANIVVNKCTAIVTLLLKLSIVNTTCVYFK